MKISALKRLIWVMNEIIAATPSGGITRAELSDRWASSCQNDDKERDIKERTFYRICDDLKSLFDWEIVCNRCTGRYTVNTEDYDPDEGDAPLLKILLRKGQVSPINQLLQMLVQGNDIPDDDMRAARDIAAAMSKLPQKYADDFQEQANLIRGADRCAPDTYYPHYVCVWDESVYQRTWQWLSIGFYANDVYFYIVSEEPDTGQRIRKATEAEAGAGVRYRGGHYWHKPLDPALFSIHFDTQPDMDAVNKRTEILLKKLAQVQSNDEISAG